MAEILLAKISGPGAFERPVVIKRILPHVAQNPEFTNMFMDEARIAAAIQHPNIVQHLDFARADGELFLVLEYLHGESLSNLTRRSQSRAQPVGVDMSTHIVAEACAGLHAAHELRGSDGELLEVIHRDVSPSNLFVTYDGAVKVIDFGVAKAAHRISRTEAGALKGKFAYMSPEQAEGEPLDRRSDVFSLGIVLYELTTRRRLFSRATATATLRAVRGEPIPRPSSLVDGYPRELEEVVLTALQRDPAKRFATAQEMRRALADFRKRSDGVSTPQEHLAERIRSMFGDRITQKQEMLHQVREGVDEPSIVRAESDLEVRIPELEAPPPPAPRARRRFRTAIWATGGILIVGLAAGAWASQPKAVQSAISDKSLRSVRIDVQTTPAGAAVVVDEERVATTPATIEWQAGTTPIALELRLPGHVPRIVEVVPDVSHRLTVELDEETAEPIEPSAMRERRRPTTRPRTPRAGAPTMAASDPWEALRIRD